MTQTVDPQGNALTFTYDSNFRMTAVTDAMGQVTTLTYGTGPNLNRIAGVTDPFGRYATFAYTTDGNLLSSTDMIGMVSTYGYTSGTLTSLTTPYGLTKFDVGQNETERWVQVTDPQGGQERLETWNNYNTDIPSSVPLCPAGFDNSLLNLRNSFYWDKKAMLTAPGNHSQSQITHWLHEPGYGIMSGQVESTKAPLESRVYYAYPNQPSPIIVGSSGQPIRVARMLDNGIAQQTLAAYNPLNNLAQSTDVLGRVTNYNYDTNNIDVTSVVQQNGTDTGLLSSATYNTQHEPLTTTDASGQTTRYTYFPNGQIHTITNAKSETTTFAYTGGYLTSITGAQVGATTSFTYDSFGRVSTLTDVNGYTLIYNYDNLNRVTKITYPDGTYDQNTYTNLDVTQTRDRQGRWTRYTYNPLEQVTAVIDSANRVTNYDRCLCGQLKGLTDARGNRTSWDQDIEGRTVTKTFAGGAVINYTYETNTSRLKSVKDAKGQITTYTYNNDDTIKQVGLHECHGGDSDGQLHLRSGLPASDGHERWHGLDQLQL